LSVNNSTLTIFIPKYFGMNKFAYILLFKFNNYIDYEKVYFTSDDFWVSVLFQSCASQGSADSQVVNSLVASQEFTFHAKANPTNYDVINVMNSMPNSTITRI
jgi:hypothetical protein